MSVSPEKPPVIPQPGQNPAEFLDIQAMPDVYMTPDQLQVPHDEVTALGEAAFIGTVADTEQSVAEQERPTGNVVWNELARLTAESTPYDQLSYDKAPTLGRIPLTLPMPNTSTYNSDAIRYATGAEMKPALQAYGVTESIIDKAEQDGWRVEAKDLPKELKNSVLTADLYEAITMSRDPALKAAATERNSQVNLEDIWKPSTLHHSTSIRKLTKVLENSHLSYMMDHEGQVVESFGRAAGEGQINFGVAKTKLPTDATNLNKLKNLSYYGYGSEGDGVYLHYLRPEGCYREGEEYREAADITLMLGGLPTTEIGAITMNNTGTATHNSLNRVKDELIGNEMFIPIFTQEGELAYSREDFDADMESKQAGTYVTETMLEDKRRADEQAQSEQIHKKQREREAREAVEKGFASVEAYKEHKAEEVRKIYAAGGGIM